MDIFLEILDNSDNDLILHAINSIQPIDWYIPLISHAFSKKWIFVGKIMYRNGELHSFDDQPMEITGGGVLRWYKNGKIHRDNDLPAVSYPDGSQSWFQNGEPHRDNDQPAIVTADGDQYWYQHGKFHRDNDLPAIICRGGFKYYWYKHDVLYYPNR